MEVQSSKKKLPGWAIALIAVGSAIYLLLIIGAICGGVLFMADNYSASHAHVSDSTYWTDMSKTMLQNDEALLLKAQETMEQGDIPTVTQMDPDDGQPGDTILRGKQSTYRIAYSDSSSYTEQAYTMTYILDTLYEKYGIVRIDRENGMIRYEFTRNNDLFRNTEDSLCHVLEGTVTNDSRYGGTTEQYIPVKDGWYYRQYINGRD